MYYGGLIYMIFYTLDYVIEKTLKQNLSAEQLFLQNYTGEKFSKKDAEYLFGRISDHKWYVSERLKRDVGMNVAAVDYFENFYESRKDSKKSGKFSNTNLKVYENLSLSA